VVLDAHEPAQTLDAGAADHFDYVTVHPYEILGLIEQGWEAEHMSIVPTFEGCSPTRPPGRYARERIRDRDCRG
jgi:hypothetical protein